MNTPNKMNREYRINAGNSSTGPIGFVLHTKAESPEAALAWAKQQLSDKTYAHDITESQTGELSIVYIYTNPQALTLADVWDVETDKCCAPASEQTPAVYNGCLRAALAIVPYGNIEGLNRAIANIEDQTAAPAMYEALVFARRTLVALGDERGAQALETIAAIDAALAAARKGGAL